MFISAYGPGSEKSEEKIEEFYNELSECLGSFGRNESVVVLRDLNARVGNEVIEGIVGRHASASKKLKWRTTTGDGRAGVCGG